jgi:hypothetical protein
LKSEEQQDFLSLDKLKSQPVTQVDDIKIDYGIYQKVKDLGRGQSQKKINQNEMRILSSIDEKKRKQPLSKGEQYRDRMDQYQQTRQKFQMDFKVRKPKTEGSRQKEGMTLYGRDILLKQ